MIELLLSRAPAYGSQDPKTHGSQGPIVVSNPHFTLSKSRAMSADEVLASFQTTLRRFLYHV